VLFAVCLAGYLFSHHAAPDERTEQGGPADSPRKSATSPGQFAAAVHYPAGLYPCAVAAGDFNGDGKLDLAVANMQSR
jgi:hypothetical protein